jgi:hypothetical protein
MLGLMATVFSCAWMSQLNEENALYIFVPAILNGAVGSVLLVTSLSLTNSLIGAQSVNRFSSFRCVFMCVRCR